MSRVTVELVAETEAPKWRDAKEWGRDDSPYSAWPMDGRRILSRLKHG